jgi:cytidine deaminase
MRPANDEERRLHALAETARERAYAPYSQFTVGAALVTESGDVVTGGNVENGSFGMTICAERSAVVRALAEGHTRFSAVVVAGPAASVPPCGACRQVLAEFANEDFTITFPRAGELTTFSLDEILPERFSL